jgi:NodT family efflux transporter outer membrane factor (OMF) lipoprotein
MAHFLPLGLVVLVTASLISGCQAPMPTPPTAMLDGLPTQFKSLQQTDPEKRQNLQSLDTVALAERLGRWWEVFNDPVLNELVSLAISANWDLQTALQRIEIASAKVTKAKSLGLPLVYGQASGNRENYGTTNSLDGLGIVDTFGFSASVSWETDVFGSIASRAQAAQFDLEAAQADRQAIMVSIVADVVATYGQLRAMQEGLALKQRYVALSAAQVKLQKDLLITGQVPAADVVKMQRDNSQAMSSIAPMQASVDVLISTCAILTGGYPRALDDLLKKPGPLLRASLPLPDAIPSQLLKQRPDIVKQEKVLLASLSDVDAARADFMPQFSIPLSIGYNTSPFSLLLNPASFVWTLGASMMAPIYTGGMLEANLRIAKATKVEDQQNYEKIVRQALKEVEDAVLEYQGSTSELLFLEKVKSEQMVIVSQQQTLFKTGIESLFQVNDAEMKLVQFREAIVKARYTQVLSLTTLYKSMGGGWVEPTMIVSQPERVAKN